MSLFLALVLAATPAGAKAKECVGCHRKATAGAVKQWEQSAHAKGKVGCADCHGTDHDRFDGGVAFVDMKVCGECHQAELVQHTRSRHGMGLHSGWGCTRNQPAGGGTACSFCHEKESQVPVSTVHCALFLKQTGEMRELGCNRCHQVERSCAACHTNHSTDPRTVRDPGVCARCHMGPDHPQWEAWETSQHGQLFRAVGPATGPTCQRCHLRDGNHDVSVGITTNQAAAPYPASVAGPARALMVTACSDCHAPGFAARELARADAVRDQSVALVQQGRAIVEDLYDRGLLDPMPANRPPHPLTGSALETGAQLLYEDTSHAERLLFKMAKYDLAKTYKGAYHQNPDYTHWYGNAELKADLVDLRAEARRLERAGPKTVTLEEQLRVLKAKVDRGVLTPAEYEQQKAKLLEKLPGKAPTRGQ